MISRKDLEIETGRFDGKCHWLVISSIKLAFLIGRFDSDRPPKKKKNLATHPFCTVVTAFVLWGNIVAGQSGVSLSPSFTCRAYEATLVP